MEKLRVEISGDSKKLEQATDKAIKELKQFEKVAKKSIGGIAKPAAKSAKGLKTLGGASANATPALLEFNRTIQDAPFGIQGVANNIQQLTANFGYLKTQTGSTKNALKAMLAGLSGPQGILLAVSLATALMVAFSNGMGRAESKAKKLTDETEKANNKIKDYIKSLSQVDQALIKGAQSAQAQIVQLNSLRKISEDTARSTTDRKKAIQELRRLFPDYFKDLDDEKIKSGNLADTYDVLTASILKRAKATALQSAIVKNAENELEVSRKLNDEVDKRSRQQGVLGGLFPKGAPSEFANSLGVASSNSRQFFNTLTSDIEDTTSEIGTLNAALANISKNSKDLIERFEGLGGIDLSNVKLPPSATVTARPKVDIIAEEIGKFEIPNLVNRGSLGKDIEDALVGPLLELPNKIDIAATQALIALNDFNDDVNAIIEGGIANTFSRLGEVIGDSLINGGNVLEAVGNTLLQGLGGLLSSIGDRLIQLGTAAVLAGTVVKLFGSVAGIGAGFAAIAGGVLIKSIGSGVGNIGANAGGGGVSGGGSSSSGSFSSSSGGGFGNGNVVFEISGRNLVGVLRRNTDSNLAING